MTLAYCATLRAISRLMNDFPAPPRPKIMLSVLLGRTPGIKYEAWGNVPRSSACSSFDTGPWPEASSFAQCARLPRVMPSAGVNVGHLAAHSPGLYFGLSCDH